MVEANAGMSQKTGIGEIQCPSLKNANRRIIDRSVVYKPPMPRMLNKLTNKHFIKTEVLRMYASQVVSR